MPTYGWIEDSDRDRRDRSRPTPQFRRTCPLCGAGFTSPRSSEAADWLSRHLATQHPLSAPVLMIRERPAEAVGTVRTRIRPGEVLIQNCSEIEATVDGEHRGILGEGAAVYLLSEVRARGLVRLRMRNERRHDRAVADADFTIRFDIPASDDLETIEKAFKRRLAHDQPSPDDVRRFGDDTEGLDRDYRDGLAAYVLAVIAKDGRSGLETKTAMERAQHQMGRASTLLGEFAGREVADTIAACANFNLNVLTSDPGRCDVEAIQLATRFLQELVASDARPEFPAHPQDVAGGLRCPVDGATARVLECLFRIVGDPGSDASELLEFADGGVATAADHAKVAAIVGELAHRRRETETLRRCTEVLANDPVFIPLARRWSSR